MTLQAISVGDRRVEYFTEESAMKEEANRLTDTGSRYTFVDSEFYAVFASVLEEKKGSKRVDDPRGS